MPDENCIFCKIVSGRAPAVIVAEWTDALAFIPLDPVTPGHTLVIPKAHRKDAVADRVETMCCMGRAVELAESLPSSNILTSIGAPATQSIFHLHIHVVPRVEGDQLMLPWGTTGDPHKPHWCKVAQRLQDQLDGEGRA